MAAASTALTSSAPRCCAPSSRRSASASAAGRSRRRARSGTHAGMPDFTRLVSFVGAERGQILDTGLIYNQLPLGLLTN